MPMHREIIAILRGVQPHEVESIGEVLIECGISTIEVPLNSPDPFESISKLARRFGTVAQIGAGTVLDKADVRRVADVGGQIIVSPDTSPKVIQATKDANLASYPGVMTPTDCFTALGNGGRPEVFSIVRFWHQRFQSHVRYFARQRQNLCGRGRRTRKLRRLVVSRDHRIRDWLRSISGGFQSLRCCELCE